MLDIFQFNSLESFYKAILEELLKKDNRKKIALTRIWTKQFNAQKGVYLIFEKDNPIYVGETGSLKGRMADLLNTKNHNLRRLLGERLFFQEKGYQKAHSKQSYIPEIELKLNEYIETQISVSCIPLEIGRKEFEEWVIKYNSDIPFYNKRKTRGFK